MRAILALGVILFSTAAAAQSGQNRAVGPDNGFFRPTPGNDPSIHAPVLITEPVEAMVQPATVQPAAPALAPIQAPAQAAVAPAVQYQQIPLVQPVAQPVPVIVPATVPPQAKAEQELDRAQAEAERAQQKAKQQPAPINGAFTGQTSERDR